MDYFLELNFQKLQRHGLDESIKVKVQGLIADWGLEKSCLHSALCVYTALHPCVLYIVSQYICSILCILYCALCSILHWHLQVLLLFIVLVLQWC